MIGNTGGVSVIEMIIISLACSEVSGILFDNFYSIRFFRLHFPKHQVITKKKKQYIPIQISSESFSKQNFWQKFMTLEFSFPEKIDNFFIEKHFAENVFSASVFDFYCVYQISIHSIFPHCNFPTGASKGTF